MSFIATEPAATEAPSTIKNDGFFPDIDLAAMRDAIRLDGTVTAARLRDAAMAAIMSVNLELTNWAADKIAAGYNTLADVPAPKVGDESVQLIRYRGAIYRTTKADLTERYRDFDATNSGTNKADRLDDTVEDHRRAARWFIREILDRPHTTVELI